MKTRTLISAIILILLCAVRFCFPEEANKIRDFIIPAISRDSDLRADFIAIGQAISGERDYVYVWERLTNTDKQVQAEPSPSDPAEDKSPLVKADASDSFPLSDMVGQNLNGYEAFAGLPSAQTSPVEASETPAPSASAETVVPSAVTEAPAPSAVAKAPSTSLPVSQPVAPETIPLESASPSSAQSAKVAEFLEEQAAFADYAVPANVSYDTPTLPFEYSSPCASSTTSGFGYRDHPIDNVVKFHYGTDIGAYDGDSITAFADGTVISVQELSGYGLTVILDHGGGYQTLYAHCSQILVKQGDSVKLGDKIALVGHSGDVTGPHLHFELIYNGKYLNPEFYL